MTLYTGIGYIMPTIGGCLSIGRCQCPCAFFRMCIFWKMYIFRKCKSRNPALEERTDILKLTYIPQIVGRIYPIPRPRQRFTAAFRYRFPPCTQSQYPINRETGVQQLGGWGLTLSGRSKMIFSPKGGAGGAHPISREILKILDKIHYKAVFNASLITQRFQGEIW